MKCLKPGFWINPSCLLFLYAEFFQAALNNNLQADTCFGSIHLLNVCQCFIPKSDHDKVMHCYATSSYMYTLWAYFNFANGLQNFINEISWVWWLSVMIFCRSYGATTRLSVDFDFVTQNRKDDQWPTCIPLTWHASAGVCS